MSPEFPINGEYKTLDDFEGFWSEDPDMKPGSDISINSNPSVTSYPISVSRPVWITFDLYI